MMDHVIGRVIGNIKYDESQQETFLRSKKHKLTNVKALLNSKQINLSLSNQGKLGTQELAKGIRIRPKFLMILADWCWG